VTDTTEIAAAPEPRVARFATATDLLEVAGPFLGEREAEHNLMFGICANLTADPGSPLEPPYLAAVRRADRVTAAALMTPPWNVVLSCTNDPDAIVALAADLDAAGVSVPGVTGAVEEAGAFAAAWCGAHDQVSRVAVAERIYRLERVVPPTGVTGHVRLATIDDRDLLVEWVNAFLIEALERRSLEEAAILVDRSFRAGTRTWYLWEDSDRPVSVAASGGPTPHGIRIGPVYTPPSLRRHGYASAVTAAASQSELDHGRRFVFLFTDLSNPTSNKIYQQIGYQPVIDVDQIAFLETGSAREA
jgi:predicted GNAT family acetyltransferase